MAGVVLLLIPLCGIIVVDRKLASLLLGLTWTLPLFPAPGFLCVPWIQVHGGHISGADIAAWPYSVGILCRFTSFLGTLHWPIGSDDIGHFGVSFFGTSDPF